MTAELQGKKKKKKNGKKKKQDLVDIIQNNDEHVSKLKEDIEPIHKDKQVSFEDGPETLSGCSKTLFLAIILGIDARNIVLFYFSSKIFPIHFRITKFVFCLYL